MFPGAGVTVIVTRPWDRFSPLKGWPVRRALIRRNLMKQPMPLSHLAAARATSSTSLRFAPRNNFITLQISPRSPSDKRLHHACGCVIVVFILIIFLVSVFQFSAVHGSPYQPH